jgi:hypothetical protein
MAMVESPAIKIFILFLAGIIHAAKRNNDSEAGKRNLTLGILE